MAVALDGKVLFQAPGVAAASVGRQPGDAAQAAYCPAPGCGARFAGARPNEREPDLISLDADVLQHEAQKPWAPKVARPARPPLNLPLDPLSAIEGYLSVALLLHLHPPLPSQVRELVVQHHVRMRRAEKARRQAERAEERRRADAAKQAAEQQAADEQAAREKAASEKAAAEKAAAEKAAAEQAASEKAAAEKAAAEKAATEKAATEKAATAAAEAAAEAAAAESEEEESGRRTPEYGAAGPGAEVATAATGREAEEELSKAEAPPSGTKRGYQLRRQPSAPATAAARSRRLDRALVGKRVRV